MRCVIWVNRLLALVFRRRAGCRLLVPVDCGQGCHSQLRCRESSTLLKAPQMIHHSLSERQIISEDP